MSETPRHPAHTIARGLAGRGRSPVLLATRGDVAADAGAYLLPFACFHLVTLLDWIDPAWSSGELGVAYMGAGSLGLARAAAAAAAGIVTGIVVFVRGDRLRGSSGIALSLSAAAFWTLFLSPWCRR